MRKTRGRKPSLPGQWQRLQVALCARPVHVRTAPGPSGAASKALSLPPPRPPPRPPPTRVHLYWDVTEPVHWDRGGGAWERACALRPAGVRAGSGSGGGYRIAATVCNSNRAMARAGGRRAGQAAAAAGARAASREPGSARF